VSYAQSCTYNIHAISRSLREQLWRLTGNTAIIAVVGDVEDTTNKSQCAVDKISHWTDQWLIKLTGDKSTHVTFTNKRCHYVLIIMNGKTIPHSLTVKFLGKTLDTKLRWKVHVKEKKGRVWFKIQTPVLDYGTTISHVNT
jgi:hypothetical protein